jgi:hypothetical protein
MSVAELLVVYIQSDVDRVRWVEDILLRPMSHEPRLPSNEGFTEQQTTNEKYPEQENVGST